MQPLSLGIIAIGAAILLLFTLIEIAASRAKKQQFTWWDVAKFAVPPLVAVCLFCGLIVAGIETDFHLPRYSQ